jgi:hypothetical protein
MIKASLVARLPFFLQVNKDVSLLKQKGLETGFSLWYAPLGFFSPDFSIII